MTVAARVETATGGLPRVSWRWDAETDILSGSFKGARRTEGLTGTVELTDDVGSIAVLDVEGGVICGLDIVVWPEVVTVAGLRAPEPASEGLVVLSSKGSRPIESLEVDTALAVETNGDESVLHLRIGPPRPARTVRVADHLAVEVDDDGALAGFWLSGVPAFPAGDEY